MQKEVNESLYDQALAIVNKNISKLWSPQGLMFFIGLVAMTAGVNTLGDFVNWILDLRILARLDCSNYLFQILIVLFSIVCVINQIRLIKNGYKCSGIQKSYFLFILILVLTFKISPHSGWKFTPLFSIEYLNQVDLVILSNLPYWFFVLTPVKLRAGIWCSIQFLYVRFESYVLYRFKPRITDIISFTLLVYCWALVLMISIEWFKLVSTFREYFLKGVLFITSAFIFKYLLYYVLVFILFCWEKFTAKKRKIVGEKEEVHFFYKEDIPIGDEKNPELSRSYQMLGQNLAEKLSNQIFKDAFSVGIVGPWGTGKSSFINHVLKKATTLKCNSKPIKVIRFYPAYNHSPEQIINDFFATLIDNLKQYNGKLKSTLVSYSLKLIEASVNKKKDFQTILSPDNFLLRQRPVYQLYKDLNEIIENLPVKPVIVIDDLDRLKPDEILEVLRIIRNTANFHNTVFLVALDKEYVRNVISHSDWTNDHAYIEKYFQLEIYLPQNRKSELKDYFLSLMIEHIKEVSNGKINGVDHAFAVLRKYLYDDGDIALNSFVSNYRDVKKIFNQYVQNLSFLDWQVEVDYVDLLHFTLLKAKYPAFVYYLYQNWNLFFESKDGHWTYRRKSVTDNKLEDKEPVIFYFLNEKADNFYCTEMDLPKLTKLIIALFGFSKSNLPSDFNINGTNNDSRLMYRMSNVNRTDIYFNLLLSENELPIAKFYGILYEGSKIEFLKFIKEITQLNNDNSFGNGKIISEIKSLLNRLTEDDITKLHDIEKVLEAYMFIYRNNNDLFSILKSITQAKELRSKGGISDEKVMFSFLRDYIFDKMKNLNLVDLFDLYTEIENDINNNDIHSYSIIKWGADEESLSLLRQNLIEKLIRKIKESLALNESLIDQDSNWLSSLIEKIKVTDIRDINSLNALLKYQVNRFYNDNLTWLNFIELLNYSDLVEDRSVISQDELFETFDAIFENKSLNVNDRLTGLKYIMNSSLGEQDLIDNYLNNYSKGIREKLIKEFLENKKHSFIDRVKLIAKQMQWKYSMSLLHLFKNVLNQDEYFLKELINYCVVKESGTVHYFHGYILNIFRQYDDFIYFLKQCDYSDTSYVKECVHFYSVYSVFHEAFENEYKAFYEFKHIKPNLRFIEDSNMNNNLIEGEVFLFKIRNKEIISELFSIIEKDNPCISKNKDYLLYHGVGKDSWNKYFEKSYGSTQKIFITESSIDSTSLEKTEKVIKQSPLEINEDKYFVGSNLVLEKFHSSKFKIDNF